MAKRGPKNKLTTTAKERVIDLLTLGMSLADTLLLVGCSRRTLDRTFHEDKKFARGVKGAAQAGKAHHLRRVANAEERWQASAWFLERKYGTEYGTKIKLDMEAVIATRIEEHIVHAPAPHPETTNGAAPGAGRLQGL